MLKTAATTKKTLPQYSFVLTMNRRIIINDTIIQNVINTRTRANLKRALPPARPSVHPLVCVQQQD